MNIVVTLAGHSRRFKDAGYSKPKFLIELDGKIMLEHVLEMFAFNDNFFFVVNTDQVANNDELLQTLESIRPRTSITIIKPHERGPIFSVLQITNLPPEEEVIISYCDFTVQWNYESFKRQAHGSAMAIPAFSGFQPSSFGRTNYAYMKVDADSNLIELREKESFTKIKQDEAASAGIYYFCSWSLFKDFAIKLENIGYGKLSEGYVSLISNLLVEGGYQVKVTNVRKFICFGTPEDLDIFYFWQRYFRDMNSQSVYGSQKPNTVNVVPMAGKGRRFSEEHFRTRKPFIGVGAKPMVSRACASLPAAGKWIILPLEEDAEKYPLQKLVEQSVSGEVRIISVPSVTSGQAATCLLGMSEVNHDDEILISSCDYEVKYDFDDWSNLVNDKDVDACLWCVRANVGLFKQPEAFAYCATQNGSNRVEKIFEKETISDDPSKDPLVIGVFWFRRASDFIDLAEQAIRDNITVNGEHYIANAMNLMIQRGKEVRVFWADQWISFGDPFELEMYNFWDEYFDA